MPQHTCLISFQNHSRHNIHISNDSSSLHNKLGMHNPPTTHNQNHSRHNIYIQWDLAHVSYDSNDTNNKLDTHKPPTDTQTHPFRPEHTYSLNMNMFKCCGMDGFVCVSASGSGVPNPTCVSRWFERCHIFYTISTTHTIKLGRDLPY